MKHFFLLSLMVLSAIACTDETLTFSITPSIGFENPISQLLETRAEGIRINLYSNAAFSETVKVTLSVTNIGGVQYGVDYTTEPAVVDNVLTLTLDPETQQPGFFLYPVAGTFPVRKVVFEIIDVTGASVAKAQAAALTHTVSITKQQVDQNQLSIAQVRAFYTGATITLSEDKFIEGIVISTNDNVTAKNVYIQDNSAGIVLRFNANNTTDPGKVLLGELIRVPIKGVTLTAFNGLIQLGDGTTTLPHSKIQKLGTATLPEPKVITIDQLIANDFQSQRVTLKDVVFPDANGTKTYTGNNTIRVGTKTSTLRVESFAPFSTTVLPLGVVSITGIASTFTTSQLVPMAASDIKPQ